MRTTINAQPTAACCLIILLATPVNAGSLRGTDFGRQLDVWSTNSNAQYAVASKTGYEYSNPPALPSCQGSQYHSVANGVAMSGNHGMDAGMCGKCFQLTAAPEQFDAATYQQQGNNAQAGWSMIVKVVDTCPGCAYAAGLPHVFDLPDSMFSAASSPHAGANGVASGHIPIQYEEVDCNTGIGNGGNQSPTSTPAPAPANNNNNNNNNIWGLCQSTGAHPGYTNSWCDSNCNHVPANCPQQFCTQGCLNDGGSGG